MLTMRRVLDFYINSSVHVALAVTALTVITYLTLGMAWDYSLVAFIFFGSVTGYNFVKYAGLAGLHHRSLAQNLRVIQVFSFVCFGMLLFYAFKLPWQTLLYAAAPGLLTFFYAMPLRFPLIDLSGWIRNAGDTRGNLRSLTGIKIFVIAFVWAWVTVFLPALHGKADLSYDVWVVFGQRFLFVIAVTLPFEIRDLRYDSDNLGTIPQYLGVRRTKIFGLTLLMFFYFSMYFKDGVTVSEILAHFTVSVLAALSIWFAQIDQPRYYSAFLVEGIPLYWLGILLLFGELFV